MPARQDWSWQMRKRASADRRDRRRSHLSLVNASTANAGKPVPLEPDVQAHIGTLLRTLYDATLKEPVPERLLDVLRQMDVKSDFTSDPPAPPECGRIKPK
jgi:hypothetical protein